MPGASLFAGIRMEKAKPDFVPEAEEPYKIPHNWRRIRLSALISHSAGIFSRPISMIERENVLRDFLISTLTGETGLSDYLHIRTRGIVPAESLLESMVRTLIDGRSGVNAINQTSMGLLLMNLSRFAENIDRDNPNRRE